MKLSVITPSIRPHYLDITQKCLERQTHQDFEWHVVVGLRNKGFALPTDWNRLLRMCTSDVVVLLQDCIHIPDDALERIAELDHTMTAYTFPVGKVKKIEDTPAWDWRKDTAKARNTDILPGPAHWEADFASAPRSMFYDVGGFDEEFNDGWSWENVEIAYRAAKAGYTFKVSTVTSGVAIDHDALEENPFRNKKRNNDWRADNTRRSADMGEWKLDFLH